MAQELPKLKATFRDGREVVVEISFRSQVALEKFFGVSFQDAQRMDHLGFLVWIELHPEHVRLEDRKAAEKEFADFLYDEIRSIEAVDEPADPTPGSGAEDTTPTASTTGSSG